MSVLLLNMSLATLLAIGLLVGCTHWLDWRAAQRDKKEFRAIQINMKLIHEAVTDLDSLHTRIEELGQNLSYLSKLTAELEAQRRALEAVPAGLAAIKNEVTRIHEQFEESMVPEGQKPLGEAMMSRVARQRDELQQRSNESLKMLYEAVEKQGRSAIQPIRVRGDE